MQNWARKCATAGVAVAAIAAPLGAVSAVASATPAASEVAVSSVARPGAVLAAGSCVRYTATAKGGSFSASSTNLCGPIFGHMQITGPNGLNASGPNVTMQNGYTYTARGTGHGNACATSWRLNSNNSYTKIGTSCGQV